MSEQARPIKMKLNGRPVLGLSETDVEFISNDGKVYTFDEGLAGFSNGAAEIRANFQNAVPLGGWRINWPFLTMSHSTIRPSFEWAGTIYECEGRVTDSGFRSQTNQPSAARGSFQGKMISMTAG